ncbi:MAG: hypothetical protein QJR00_02885 [Bacillota bacterium]|nr:hypothetical protein [Bacillota bacterium]
MFAVKHLLAVPAAAFSLMAGVALAGVLLVRALPPVPAVGPKGP